MLCSAPSRCWPPDPQPVSPAQPGQKGASVRCVDTNALGENRTLRPGESGRSVKGEGRSVKVQNHFQTSGSIRRAFSLVELIVVMVILGMLAGLVAVRTRGYLINSKQNAAKTEIANIVKALETFYAGEGRYPTTDEGLELLTQDNDSFPGGILNKVPKDPWKRPYEYVSPGSTQPYEVISLAQTVARAVMERTEISLVKLWATMRKAFTLIELVVVMVVLALLASLTVYSLGGTMDRHRLSRAIETIEMFDARARRTARTTQHAVTATIDRSRGQLSIDTHRNPQAVSFRLPSRVAIGDVRFGTTRRVERESKIEINGQGRSVTYAIQLRRGKLTRWLVVLGISGQVVAMENVGEVNAILSL